MAADKSHLTEFTLRMGDNCLVLGQRLSAWCGHGPILEEDIALANTALDLVGQAKLWLSLAGEWEGKQRNADDLAFLRDARAFRNVLLVEQANGDYAHTLMRQFLFDAWHRPMLEALTKSSETQVAAIAEKSVKEADYHLERSADLVIRLGDGTEESHTRMQAALDEFWPFTGELLETDATEKALIKEGVLPDLAPVARAWEATMGATLDEATLIRPESAFMRKGGRTGLHTEELGFVLAEMQFLQRAYPGAKW